MLFCVPEDQTGYTKHSDIYNRPTARTRARTHWRKSTLASDWLSRSRRKSKALGDSPREVPAHCKTYKMFICTK